MASFFEQPLVRTRNPNAHTRLNSIRRSITDLARMRRKSSHSHAEQAFENVTMHKTASQESQEEGINWLSFTYSCMTITISKAWLAAMVLLLLLPTSVFLLPSSFFLLPSKDNGGRRKKENGRRKKKEGRRRKMEGRRK